MFANHLQQILATQIDSNNLALAIQKDVGGDRTHAIDFGGSALPAFQVRHLRPLHAQALHGSCPCVLLVVEGYANNLQPFVLILLVGCHDVGISWRQGPHQLAQKSTRTYFPLPT